MKKSSVKTPHRRRRSPAPSIFLALVVVLCLFFGWMHLQARMTRLCPAEVYLPDLPRALDGTRVLYISDFKLQSAAEARSAGKLMRRLQELAPDLLLLGGDYCGSSVLDSLNGTANVALPDYVADFIASLADFPAPMGKFAVAGDSDGDPRTLAAAFQAAGVNCLADSAVTVSKNGADMSIAGLTDRSLNRNGSAKLSRSYHRDDCVLVLAHNPTSYIDVRVSEAEGGGAWADLVLAGHTLGGQINVLGRTLRSFSPEEQRTLSGWFYPNDLPLLVSEGLGCDGAPLRLGSNSQIHLLILRRQEIVN